MAVQPTVKTAPSVPVRAPRAASKRTFDYSRFRLTLSKPDEFAAYLGGYPQKGGLQLYIYRLQPKIDFGLIGRKEHTIRQTFEVSEMNPDFVAREFGRGKYQFKLNDKMREKGQTEVCNMVFTIDDPELEPVYDVRTLCLGAPENLDEINRLIEKGALIRDANNVPRIRTERDGPARSEPGPVTLSGGRDEIISREFVGQALLKLITQSTQNPSDMLTQVISMAKLIRPESSAAPAMTVEQIIALVDRQRAVDPFTNWERVQGFLDKARGAVGSVVTASTSESSLAGISEVLKGAAVVIPQVIAGIDFLQKQRARLAVQVNGPGTARTSAPGADNNGGMDQRPQQQPRTMADRIGEVAQLGYMKMREGLSGFDFAAYICQWHEGGLEVFKFLEPNGPVGFIGLMTMDPRAAAILNDPVERPQLEKFLTEFFNFDPDPGDEEDDEEGDTSPLAAAS
jgi:hypothetical protein